MKHKLFYIISLLLILVSCGKHRSQLPANKGNTADSTEINLRKMNETLAQKEDSIIQAMVSKEKRNFQKIASGIWYRKEVETTLDSLKNEKEVSFQYAVYTLNGADIKTEKTRLRFGRKEVAAGLEEGLMLMRKGEKMCLIVPWYLAYGMMGKDNIPPYTSLIYEITAEK